MRHRSWREPRTHTGMLVQLDGSLHEWFGLGNGYVTLITFIDDATSKVLWSQFYNAESTENVMRALKGYIQKHGRPLALYTDRGSAYKVNVNNEENDRITQVQQALGELDIELIHARYPQAKGRIERHFRTPQDRLVKELKLEGITSIQAANEYLNATYIPKHNARFARPAAKNLDLHRTLLAHHDLSIILSIKEQRILRNDYTISYNKQILQLTKHQKTILRPKDTITIRRPLDGSISLFIRKTPLYFVPVKKRPQPLLPPPEPKPVRIYPRPAPDHPWRRYPAC